MADKQARVSLQIDVKGNAPEGLRKIATALGAIDSAIGKLAPQFASTFGAIEAGVTRTTTIVGGLQSALQAVIDTRTRMVSARDLSQGTAARPFTPARASLSEPGGAAAPPRATAPAVGIEFAALTAIMRETGREAVSLAERLGAAAAAMRNVASSPDRPSGGATGGAVEDASPPPPGAQPGRGVFAKLKRFASFLPGFAEGGEVGGDTLARVHRGEHVVNAASAGANRSLLEKVNAARGPLQMEGGGAVSYLAAGTPRTEADEAADNVREMQRRERLGRRWAREQPVATNWWDRLGVNRPSMPSFSWAGISDEFAGAGRAFADTGRATRGAADRGADRLGVNRPSLGGLSWAGIKSEFAGAGAAFGDLGREIGGVYRSGRAKLGSIRRAMGFAEGGAVDAEHFAYGGAVSYLAGGTPRTDSSSRNPVPGMFKEIFGDHAIEHPERGVARKYGRRITGDYHSTHNAIDLSFYDDSKISDAERAQRKTLQSGSIDLSKDLINLAKMAKARGIGIFGGSGSTKKRQDIYDKVLTKLGFSQKEEPFEGELAPIWRQGGGGVDGAIGFAAGGLLGRLHGAEVGVRERAGHLAARHLPTLSPVLAATWRAYWLSHTVPEGMANAVGREQGLSETVGRRLAMARSVANKIGMKAVPAAMGLLGAGPLAIGAGTFAPLGSLAYLAGSAVVTPRATARAAQRGLHGMLQRGVRGFDGGGPVGFAYGGQVDDSLLPHYKALRASIAAGMQDKSDVRRAIMMSMHSLRAEGALRAIPEGSRFLGSGIAGQAFKTPQGDVVRIQSSEAQRLAMRWARTHEHPSLANVPMPPGSEKPSPLFQTARPNVPEVLQPTFTGAFPRRGTNEHTILERLPYAEQVKAPTGGIRGWLTRRRLASQQEALKRSMWDRGLSWQDDRPDFANVGMVGGAMKVIDPGGIVPHTFGPSRATPWQELTRDLQGIGSGLRRALGGVGGGARRALGFAEGGGVDWQPRGTDTIPAVLAGGAFVVNRASTQANRGLLDQLGGQQVPAMLTPGETVFSPDTVRSHGGLLARVNAAKGPVGMAGGGRVRYLDTGGSLPSTFTLGSAGRMRVPHGFFGGGSIPAARQVPVLVMNWPAGFGTGGGKEDETAKAKRQKAEERGEQEEKTFLGRFKKRLPEAMMYGGLEGIGRAGLSALPPQAQMALGAFKVVESALQGLTKGLNTFGDSTASAANKTQGLIEAIPIVGGALGGFMQTVTDFGAAIQGIPDQVRRSQQALQIATVDIGAERKYRGKIQQAEYEAGGAASRATALAAFARGPLEMGPTARTTTRERVAYEENQQRTGHEEERRQALAEAGAARQTAAAAAALARDASGTYEHSQRRYGVAMGRSERATNFAAGQSWTERLTNNTEGRVATAHNEAAAAGLKLASDRELHEQGITRAREAQLRVAEADNRARQAGVAISQANLNIARQKEQRREGAAERVGAMHPVDAQIALRNLRQLRQRGTLQGASPWQIENAASVAPEYVRGLQRQRGEQTLRRSGILNDRELNAEFGGRGTMASLQGATNQAAEELRQATRDSVSTFATESSTAMSAFTRDIVAAWREGWAQMRREIREQMAFANVNRRAGG